MGKYSRYSRTATSTELRKSRYWRNRVAAERRRLERDKGLAVCWLCGVDIDMSLPTNHPRAFSLDHIIPLTRGGRIDGEAKPAHISCNSERGGRENKRSKATDGLMPWEMRTR